MIRADRHVAPPIGSRRRPRPDLTDRDPNNVWLARQSRFRPEAEVIRDLALAASGLLNLAIGGPSVRPPQPPGIVGIDLCGQREWVDSNGRGPLPAGDVHVLPADQPRTRC